MLAGLVLAAIAFVPLDDRPVTALLPVALGRIAGVAVATPPPKLLGRYLHAGDADAIGRWTIAQSHDPRTNAFVVSTDMLAYGGLVASRVPAVSYADAYSRLQALRSVRRNRPSAWIAAFGTVARLAPTGVPADSGFFAAYPGWSYLQRYANLPDPPVGAQDRQSAATLRGQIGESLLAEYLGMRARNFAIDRRLLALAADGTVDRLALGQDDAGPVGLHVREVAFLKGEAARLALGERASIEPGADELGMALTAGALARKAAWIPRVAVAYSTPSGAQYADPLEFAPVSAAIDGLIALCGGVRDDLRPDITLYVRIPNTGGAQDAAFLSAIARDTAAGRSTAVADLSFLHSYADQAAFATQLLASGAAARLDAYASWNTNANTVGTALAEAVAAGAGRRMRTYDALSHREFTFVRFLDDYVFHDVARPALNAWLDDHDIADRTLLRSQPAAEVESLNRALVWNRAQAVAAELDPGYHIAALTIALPWQRTFETRIEAALAPNL